MKAHARGFAELADRTAKERQALIDDPETGAAFARDMFLTELEDHEYSWTGDAADALTALGYTWDRVQADPVLKRAFEEAEKIAAQRE